MDFFKRFKTRWRNIAPNQGYRLACNHPTCSLSSANLKKGKISITSTHGDERHSYELTGPDMMFATVSFLNHLSELELQMFIDIFNDVSRSTILSAEKIDS